MEDPGKDKIIRREEENIEQYFKIFQLEILTGKLNMSVMAFDHFYSLVKGSLDQIVEASIDKHEEIKQMNGIKVKDVKTEEG